MGLHTKHLQMWLQIHIIIATLTTHVGILIAAISTIIVEVAHPALPQTAPILAHKLVLGAGVVLGHTHLAVVANDKVTSFVAGALHLVVGGRVTTLTAAAIVVGAQVVGACQRDRGGLLSCCLTSTEAGWPIRDRDRVGRGQGDWLDRGNRPKKTGETVDRRQNNGSVKVVSPRHCPATCALCNCSFNCCAGQSH